MMSKRADAMHGAPKQACERVKGPTAATHAVQVLLTGKGTSANL